MAKITIIEDDSSRVNNLTNSRNIVYVPGYSKMGPVNTPTLCNSRLDFEQLFGDAPFKFNGEYEKSWIYAEELLSAGLPVLYERIYNETGKTKAKAEFEIAKSVAAAEVNTFEYNGTTYYVNEEGTAIYTILLASGEIDTESAVTNNTIDGNVVTIDMDESRVSIDGDIYTITKVATAFELQTLAGNSLTIEAKYFGGLYNDTNVTIDIDTENQTSEVIYNLTITIGNTIITKEFTLNVNNSNYINKIFADNQFVTANFVKTDDFDNDCVLRIGTKQLVGGSDAELVEIEEKLNSTENDSPINKLKDKSLYDVKFITSGGYCGLADEDNKVGKKLIQVAGNRGEALAIIDFANKNEFNKDEMTIVKETFLQTAKTSLGEDENSFGTIVGPSQVVRCECVSDSVLMPGSFIFLKELAKSVVNNPIWLAIAGASRGLVTNHVASEFEVSSATLSKWQDGNQCINPIMNLRSIGQCIFGNRTLMCNPDVDNPSALAFTNVRILCNELKKATKQVCEALMFESNDILLWNNFKSGIQPLLEKMKNNRGLVDYKLDRRTTGKRATLSGVITIMPIEAVESFDIRFSIENATVTVE